MAALKEVRQRIKAVKGIGQVTKAMKLVASVKLRRVQDKVVQVRPYTDTLYEIATRLAAAQGTGEGGEAAHPLLVEGPPGAEVLIVIGSDRGLCGSFNMALFRHVMSRIRGTDANLVLVGRKAREFFARQPFNVVKTYERMPFPMTWEETERIARDTVAMYTFMRLSRIRLAYQKFIGAGTSKPSIVSWLPFVQAQPGGKTAAAVAAAASALRCEPSVEAVLDLVLPRALTAQLQQALLESQASEQGARMVAMDNATTNSSELASDLNLLANKLRQSGITKELLEITTGAEALNN